MYAALNGIDWFILGPITMTALFLGISIPLMEHRQLANKPDYAAYRRHTRLLI
jgi:steroid 5-alpha reductase family enzyme